MTQAKKVGRDLTTGPIFQQLMTFAFPIILANLVQQLYSMVDLMIIGKFVGNVGTVGVNTGGEIADFLTPVATAFATAGQIYIAQLAGAKAIRKLKEAIGTYISLLMLMSVIFMVLTYTMTNPVLHLLNCPAEAMSQAGAYMRITALGIPFIFGYNAVCGLLRGMGESKRPLLFVIIAAVINIFLDLFLVVVIPLQAAGTAIATVVSQIGAFAASFIYMYRHKDTFEFEMSRQSLALRAEHVKVILGLGVPQAIRSILVRISILWVNASINSCGAVASGTNGIGNKLQKFIEIYSASFSQASAAMIGQNLGAKKHDRAKKTVRYTAGICLVFATLVSILIWIFPRQIFGIFTNDPDVLRLGVVYMQILIVHIYASAVTGSYQSMVIGAGNAPLNFVIGILDGVVCKIGLSLLIVNVILRVSAQTDWWLTSIGFFWGTALSRILPALVCIIYFRGAWWKRRKTLSED